MIEIKNISKQFGKLKVLNNVNLTLNKGECIAMIGPNGCGKTTLIKSILGMVVPSKGEILVNNKVIRNEFEYRSQIGYMPQIGRYPDNMSIGQIIEMMKQIRSSNNTIDENLYHQFQLDKILHKKMRTLSGGTTQKVSATLAFMFQHTILILDEPTAGLDPVASEILKEKIIEEKSKGTLILITSHLLSELDELITQLVFMQDGNIIFHQPVESLLKETGESKISKAIPTILKQRMHA